MRGNDFLNKMELIDAAYVEAADAMPKSRKKFWFKCGTAAACLCLAIVSLLTLTGTFSLPDSGKAEKNTPSDSPEIGVHAPYIPAIIYNDADALISASRRYIPGYFTEKISEKKLSAIIPKKLIPNMELSATAGFDVNGTLIDVFLDIKIPSLNNTVNVTFSKENPQSCYKLSEDAVSSLFNGIYFTVCQWTADKSNYTLVAFAKINDWTMEITYTTTAEALEKAKKEFAQIILCFSEYEKGKPDFSTIAPLNIPEYFDKKISLTEAAGDPDFGAFMPQYLPEGFSEENIRRYKDQNNDYLSGLWSKGLATLSWNVSFYDENDSTRFTSIDTPENYDLSLYPIPRADSVPETLREIVDNPIFDADELTLETVRKRAYKIAEAGDIDGWRMAFSVRYRDILVEVRTKGVAPEWVYQQLINLLGK